MQIHVWIWGYLTQFLSDKNIKKYVLMEVGEGTTTKKLISELKIPEWAVDMIFLNGALIHQDEVLKDGDNLALHPRVLAGG